MKKYIFTVLVIITIVLGCIPAFASNLIADYDFENISASKLYEHPFYPNNSTTAVFEPAQENGNKYTTLKSDYNAGVTVRYRFDKALKGENIIVSFDMRFNDMCKVWGKRGISLVKEDNKTLRTIMTPATNTSDKISLRGENAVELVSESSVFKDMWYRVEININTVMKNYAVTINGVQLAEKGSLKDSDYDWSEKGIHGFSINNNATISGGEALFNGYAKYDIDNLRVRVIDSLNIKSVTPDIDNAVIDTKVHNDVIIKFDTPLKNESFTTANFVLTKAATGENIAYNYETDGSEGLFILKANGLEGYTSYIFTISDQVESVYGYKLNVPASFSFTTGEPNYIKGENPKIIIDGVESSAITAGNIEVRQRLTNYSSINKDVLFITVLRNKTDKPNVSFDKKTIIAGDTQEFATRHTLRNDNGAVIDIMLWSDFYKPHIMSDVIRLGNVGEQNGGVKFKLENTLRSEASGRRVAVKVFCPGKDTEDLANSALDVINDVLYDVAQTNSDYGGSFCYDVLFDDNLTTNEYTIKAFADGEDSEIISSYYFVNALQIENYLKEINNANQNGIKKAVTDYIAFVRFEYPAYDESNDEIFAGVLRQRDNLLSTGQRGFENSIDLSEAIISHSVLAMLTQAKDSMESSEILNDYNMVLKTKDIDKYLQFETSNFGENRRTMVYEALCGIKYTNKEHYKKTFREQVVLALLNTVTNYTEVSEIIKNEYEILGVETAKYSALKRKADVDKIISEEKFKSVEEFQTIFYAAVEIVSEKIVDVPSTGGGAGRGATVKISEPIVEEPKYNMEDTNGFLDLNDALWAKESILFLVQKGIISGGKYFRPNDSILREEFIKLLIMSFSVEITGNECNFTDVSKEQWYYPFVAAAAKEGIAKGNTNGEFGIGESLTRQDAVTMLYRAVVIFGKTISERMDAIKFSDAAEISDYAREGVSVMQIGGVINGIDKENFNPLDVMTRAQAAKIIHKLMERIDK